MFQWVERALVRFPWISRRDPCKKLMRELDKGQFDDSIDAAAGSVSPAEPEQYSDIKPFDPRAWAAARSLRLRGRDRPGVD